ncbi:DUF4097 domain-containing protein [Streptomyces sp. NBC_01167]|uniref:DUF4097 family beta strand repeat-containing protein n=1 Tax=Streptomyces sp. NBC_01167 TaxID=2903756 RepID=UPI003863FBF3|nr:DUF4097 domain-containing protein [Streptomyces sp. NBC_01167]
MPTFETPKPITATVHLESGTVRIIASQRTDTVVEIHPASAAEADVQAAQQTRAGCTSGKLLVKTPKGRVLNGAPGSVRVEIALPQGSRLNATAARGSVTCAGAMGECGVTVQDGDIRIEQAGAVQLRTHNGDITVVRTGDAEIATGSGELRIGAVVGTAVIKNSDGLTQLDEITGEAQLKTGEGTVSIGIARAAVTATCATGDICIDEAHGRVDLRTRVGNIQVGIPEGTAAWLDADAQAGTIHRMLDTADGTGESGASVDVRVRTSSGDIVVHRAQRAPLARPGL